MSKGDFAKRAAAEGKDESRYVAEFVEHAMSGTPTPYPQPTEQERAQLRAAAERVLEKARKIAPSLTGPIITDFDKAFGEIMREKFERQGLKF